MIKIKYSIRVFIDSRDGRVMCRVRWNNRKYEVSFVTGAYAQESKWDPDMQKAKRGSLHTIRNKSFSASEINDSIAEYREVIENCFSRCALNNTIPTSSELKKMVHFQLGREDQAVKPVTEVIKNINQLFEEFMASNIREKNWSYHCKIRYEEAFSHLIEAVPDITPNCITIDSMFTLREWFLDHGYKNRTTNKNVLYLKAFFRWINKHGFNIDQEVLNFNTNLKVIGRPVSYLSYEELQDFYNFKFKKGNEHLEKARDLWVFMACTSLRYSDLADLKPVHIIDGNRIEKYTQKTDDLITIPLTDIAKEIIEKYKETDKPDDLLLPIISNQKLNEYIKDAAKAAGIDRLVSNVYFVGNKRIEETHKFFEVLSCHDARRTFVSCSLSLGIPAEVVMKATGHSSYKSMVPYIATSNKTQALEMEKWNKSKYRCKIINLINDASEEKMAQILEAVQKIVE